MAIEHMISAANRGALEDFIDNVTLLPIEVQFDMPRILGGAECDATTYTCVHRCRLCNHKPYFSDAHECRTLRIGWQGYTTLRTCPKNAVRAVAHVTFYGRPVTLAMRQV